MNGAPSIGFAPIMNEFRELLSDSVDIDLWFIPIERKFRLSKLILDTINKPIAYGDYLEVRSKIIGKISWESIIAKYINIYNRLLTEIYNK